jgi:hypothetical protein
MKFYAVFAEEHLDEEIADGLTTRGHKRPEVEDGRAFVVQLVQDCYDQGVTLVDPKEFEKWLSRKV